MMVEVGVGFKVVRVGHRIRNTRFDKMYLQPPTCLPAYLPTNNTYVPIIPTSYNTYLPIMTRKTKYDDASHPDAQESLQGLPRREKRDNESRAGGG